MSNAAVFAYNNNKGGGLVPAIFTVTIHRCVDISGYWAECPMPNGCCFTDGETLQETQKNMFESVELYLEDYPDISSYSLVFEVHDA